MPAVTSSNGTGKLLSSKVIKLVAEQALCRPEDVNVETRIGEDLHIIGDDACELLSEFAERFSVDMSEMNFSTYFPDEATSDMNFYLTTVTQSKRNNIVLNFFRFLESKFWRVFAKKIQYQSITVHDLIEAAAIGKWREIGSKSN